MTPFVHLQVNPGKVLKHVFFFISISQSLVWFWSFCYSWNFSQNASCRYSEQVTWPVRHWHRARADRQPQVNRGPYSLFSKTMNSRWYFPRHNNTQKRVFLFVFTAHSNTIKTDNKHSKNLIAFSFERTWFKTVQFWQVPEVASDTIPSAPDWFSPGIMVFK